MKRYKKTQAVVIAGAALTAAPAAFAQSSVTLYGIVDMSMAYQNSQTTLGSTRADSPTSRWPRACGRAAASA